MSTTLRVSDATRRRALALASTTGTTIGELVDRALDEYERARFWQQAREALAEEPGVELEDHDVFSHALSDNLDRG